MSLEGKPRAFIGLDIGTRYIKFVELLDRGRHIALGTYAIASRPPGQKILPTILNMFEQANVSADSIILETSDQDPALPSKLARDLARHHFQVVSRHTASQALGQLQHAKHHYHLVCDIGALATSCYAFNGQHPTHQLHYPYGTVQALQVLADDGLPSADLLIGLTPAAPAKISRATSQAVEPILKLIQRLLQAMPTPPLHITLSGGGALIPGLPEHSVRHINIATSIIYPWHNISHPDGMDAILDQRGSQLALAIALARTKIPL
jgi:Tfp pilus assembly PilM family ATPase